MKTLEILYRQDIKNFENNKNILSYTARNKDVWLPITKIGWRFIWLLVKNKIKGYGLFFMVTPLKENQHIDFFKIK